MENKKFNPLIFLASLGAGGIAIMPFAFLQYTLAHGAGLVKIADVGHGTLSPLNEIYFRLLESVMVFFTLAHFTLTAVFLVKLYSWMKTRGYHELLEDPLRNSSLLAPILSIAMSMNVMIGSIRFFIPQLAENLQSVMAPALAGWAILWTLTLFTEIELLKISFSKSFDVSKISFGWLLHPFTLGMVTVVGTGIAAMAKSHPVANTAAFMSLISGSMGLFLLVVKLISIFKSHFAQDGLPERQFLPSFLIVVPNITLYAISIFRFGHYLEHIHEFHMGAYFLIVITAAFAFEFWYMLFGLALLSGYFKNHFFNKEYYVSQWGLVCPVVAFGVLASFVYKVFLASLFFKIVVWTSIIAAAALFFTLLSRIIKCSNLVKNKNITCM